MARDGRNGRQSDFPEVEVPGRYLPVRHLMPLVARNLIRRLQDAGFATIGDLVDPCRRDGLLGLLSPAQVTTLRQALKVWPEHFAYGCWHPEIWEDVDEDEQDVADSAEDDEDDQVSAGEDDEAEDAREDDEDGYWEGEESEGGDWESEQEDEVEPESPASPAGDDHPVFEVGLSELDFSESLQSGFWANRLWTVRDLMTLSAQEVMRLQFVGWEWPVIVGRLDSLIPEGHPARPYLDRFIGSAVDPDIHRPPPKKRTR